jgi:hypothetical protein
MGFRVIIDSASPHEHLVQGVLSVSLLVIAGLSDCAQIPHWPKVQV